ncbi:MAG: DUF3367 domain-containing protein [Gordonia sp. (in: high G+C Gram-positive bacteria)]|uniref:alpha-(1->3)-arabinofuranosyltransferase domain-containing protein n=1 Tax=Gordonia sp. (in: high G+C Gram-positive bacteria) TaxID=84139 RepID=UPI0039E683C1
MPRTASSKAPSSTARAAEPATPSSDTHDPTGRILARRDIGVVAVVALVFSVLQAPGRISPDTKLDLTADPIGFLARAAHLWAPDAPMGQVQNQAYGYFFPHGAFFAAGQLLHLPGWITERLWWALLLTVGFVGLVRLAEVLRVGSFASRLVAGAAFVLAPRVLTTLGTISSETLPMMLAPWVLVPMIRAVDRAAPTRPLWQLGLRAAVPVALMGAVNAVATLAAAGVAAAWWLYGVIGARGPWLRRRLVFGAWWAAGLLLACLWWLVPLLILSRVSPPFLDFIESSRVTTEWTSLTEVLRGTDSWTPFVSTERAAGAVLVSEPAAVLATGVLAAAGLAGLAMSQMPFRRRLVAIVVTGLLLICLGYPGTLGSPIAEPVRVFLDAAGAPLRNVHKFDPLIRIPIVLGVAHLLARVQLRPVGAVAHRGFAAALVVVVAVIGSGTLAWTGGIAPPGSYTAVPDHWKQAADWLADQEKDSATPSRALVVPGAPFADQLWGLTRDEPLQSLGRTPWAVRDAIPLTPPGTIRALDAVQRDLAAGRGSPGLASVLAGQGIGYLVLRADLDPTTSRSARPLLVAQALADSPGIDAVTTFGPPTAPPAAKGFVTDNGLRPALPAITVYRVTAPGADDTRPARSAPGADTGPRLTDVDAMPRIAGGPEAVAAVQNDRLHTGRPPLGPTLLEADARRAGLPAASTVVTDTPVDRETDFGRVDDHSSAIRSPDDPRLTKNTAADYPVDGQPLVEAQWLLDGQPGQVRVTSTGSAADATQAGQTSPAASAAAAFDGDPHTAWVSRDLQSAVGESMTVEFTAPRRDLAVTLTTAKAIGPDVTSILLTTDAGSTVAQNIEPGVPTRVVLPSGSTRHVEIRAIRTADGSAGDQFALTEVQLTDAATGAALPIRQATRLPARDPADGTVSEWVLHNELGARPQCVDGPDGRVLCAAALGLDPETPGVFTRTLSVPNAATVDPTVILRPAPGGALTDLLTVPGRIRAEGPSAVADVRGSAAAAVDGDPDTTWTAPEPTGRKASRPTLTLHLPAATDVGALRIHAPRDYPARPTSVIVDLGTGPQRRTVGADGLVTLTPATTSTVTVRIADTTDLLDTNDLGFTTRAPAGISELDVLHPDGSVAVPNTPDDPARPITLTCDSDPAGPLGLGLTAAGRLIRLQAHTTAGDLRAGHPIVATPCGAPLQLPAGSQEIAVNPGEAFTVDTVSLPTSVPAPVDAPTGSVPTRRWDAEHRSLDVAATDHDRVLSVPESTNPGWTALLDARTLHPVTVDGWQQGWVIPAGVGGTVHLDYAFDGLYRWSLVIGLALVAVLLVLASLPARRGAPALPAPMPADRTAVVAGTIGGIAAAWLLCGWWGLAIGAVAAAATTRLGRTARVTTVFGAMFVATLFLASGPWHSGGDYAGYALWPQLFALTGLAVLAASTLIPLRPGDESATMDPCRESETSSSPESSA